MKTNAELEKAVSDEIRMDSRLAGCSVKARIDNGIAFLEGSVSTLAQKADAELAASRVQEIRGIINHIEVTAENKMNDSEIRKSVLNAVIRNSTLDKDRVDVLVKNGWVTLEGDADFQYQKTKAGMLAQDIKGVKGVTNLISVKEPESLDRRVSAVIRKNLSLLADRIRVHVSNGCAVLTGRVNSDAERKAAEAAVRTIPGIQQVKNSLLTAGAGNTIPGIH
jgi:osmotically-inducible protein OsmY